MKAKVIIKWSNGLIDEVTAESTDIRIYRNGEIIITLEFDKQNAKILRPKGASNE